VETLGLSDSTPRSEGVLKSLLWPSIQSGADVDYLGTQGYWVCALVAVVSFVLFVATGHAFVGTIVLLYYYLGGVGVRERSRYAATAVFFMFFIDTLMSPGIVRILFAALLLSNLRATCIAAGWKPESDESALPPRLAETWSDKLSDRLPTWLWPKVRIGYYVFSAICLLWVTIGWAAILARTLVQR
jgi:hypothetical protein